MAFRCIDAYRECDANKQAGEFPTPLKFNYHRFADNHWLIRRTTRITQSSLLYTSACTCCIKKLKLLSPIALKGMITTQHVIFPKKNIVLVL